MTFCSTFFRSVLFTWPAIHARRAFVTPWTVLFSHCIFSLDGICDILQYTLFLFLCSALFLLFFSPLQRTFSLSYFAVYSFFFSFFLLQCTFSFSFFSVYSFFCFLFFPSAVYFFSFFFFSVLFLHSFAFFSPLQCIFSLFLQCTLSSFFSILFLSLLFGLLVFYKTSILTTFCSVYT